MPEELKPELSPCPLCEGNNFDAFTELEPPNCGRVRCVKCGASVASSTLARAIKNWNTRPVSELERLAREVIRMREGEFTTEVFNEALDALAAYLAEPSQKGKRE